MDTPAPAAAAAACVVFTQTAAGSFPGLPRSGACGAPLPASQAADAIVFGGYTEQKAADGSVVREPSSEAFTFTADGSGGGSWSRVEYAAGSEVPPPRLVAQCCVVGDTLWLIGGWNSSVSGPDAFLSDVWTLDLATRAWSRQQVAGSELLGGGVSRFQAALDGTTIYLHTHRCTDHILALDTAASPPRLEARPVAGEPPSSRGLHAMLPAGRALYVYGGAPQKGPMLDDLYRLDLDVQPLTWRRLAPAAGAAAPPHARCSPGAGVVGDRYLVFVGGAFYGESGGLEMLGDVAVYDTAANAWLPAQAASAAAGGALPAPRNAAVMVPLAKQPGAPLLFTGGWRAFVETFSDSYLVTLKAP